MSKKIFTEKEIKLISRNPNVKSAGKRWRAAYRKNGVAGLQDTRKRNSGRPNEKELSLKEKYASPEA